MRLCVSAWMLTYVLSLGCSHASVPPVSPTPEGIEVALTFDDLPRHGPLPAGQTRLGVHQALIAALARHKVEGVYGFVNGAGAESDDEQAALSAWVQAGHRVGNHTFSHASLKRVTTEEFVADIDRNEPLLRRLSPGDEARWKLLRFPYLEQGRDETQRRALRAHWWASGYRLAEVAIDFWDWAWQEPFAHCTERRNAAQIAELRASYLHSAEVTLAFFDSFARRLFGRRIPHVVLLHAGAFTALELDALLSLYEARGVRFVSLDHALADEGYQGEPGAAPSKGNTLQESWAERRGVSIVTWPRHPDKALQKVCR